MAGEELDLTERLNNNNINCYMGRGGDTNDIQQIRMECGKEELKLSESLPVVSDCMQPHELYSPWSSPGQNSGVGDSEKWKWKSLSCVQLFMTPQTI